MDFKLYYFCSFFVFRLFISNAALFKKRVERKSVEPELLKSWVFKSSPICLKMHYLTFSPLGVAPTITMLVNSPLPPHTPPVSRVLLSSSSVSFESHPEKQRYAVTYCWHIKPWNIVHRGSSRSKYSFGVQILDGIPFNKKNKRNSSVFSQHKTKANSFFGTFNQMSFRGAFPWQFAGCDLENRPPQCLNVYYGIYAIIVWLIPCYSH